MSRSWREWYQMKYVHYSPCIHASGTSKNSKSLITRKSFYEIVCHKSSCIIKTGTTVILMDLGEFYHILPLEKVLHVTDGRCMKEILNLSQRWVLLFILFAQCRAERGSPEAIYIKTNKNQNHQVLLRYACICICAQCGSTCAYLYVFLCVCLWTNEKRLSTWEWEGHGKDWKGGNW